MALMITRPQSETLLKLVNPDEGLYETNHIFEPEYHQEEFVAICRELSETEGAFQLGSCEQLTSNIHRGTQPIYADIEDDLRTLRWEGMPLDTGKLVGNEDGDENVCALKSVCVRFGYIDLDTARSVTRSYYESTKNRAGVQKHDILINSTGDGTIGRVAVFNYDFPALVDGHITILRFGDIDLAWYVAAFLLSREGQNQIYRYINGSSGQVEIYPQDIARIWIRSAPPQKIGAIAAAFRKACEKHDEFRKELRIALNISGFE